MKFIKKDSVIVYFKFPYINNDFDSLIFNIGRLTVSCLNAKIKIFK